MKFCIIDGCNRPRRAKKMCATHYARKLRGLASEKDPETGVKVCLRPGCLDIVFCKGKCPYHYEQVKVRRRYKALVKLMGGRCKRCQNKYPYVCYDFHHRNRSEKSFSIGQYLVGYSYKRILEEALKCDLLCVNCHRITEAEIRKHMRAKLCQTYIELRIKTEEGEDEKELLEEHLRHKKAFIQKLEEDRKSCNSNTRIGI